MSVWICKTEYEKKQNLIFSEDQIQFQRKKSRLKFRLYNSDSVIQYDSE